MSSANANDQLHLMQQNASRCCKRKHTTTLGHTLGARADEILICVTHPVAPKAAIDMLRAELDARGSSVYVAEVRVCKNELLDTIGANVAYCHKSQCNQHCCCRLHHRSRTERKTTSSTLEVNIAAVAAAY
eukprot:16921-Heterococcus_DN1.PRE.1